MTTRHLPLLLALAGAPLAISMSPAQPAMAQVSDAQQRALNLARVFAVRINGTLTRYNPASCMFNTREGGGECLVSTTGGFRFAFLGGTPGWQQLNIAPTVETEIVISADGREVLQLVYNGSPR